jgi:hypothetical protein
MTIADKLTQIAERFPIVYSEGLVKGRKAEYDGFWDTLQNYGAKSDYGYAFAGALWTDDIFNPKYDIICKSAVNMFRFADITDSKVSIDVSGVNGTYMFYSCQNLKTVRKIIVTENNLFTGFLQSCPNLEEVRFEGIIGKSLDLHWSTKLSAGSYKSILDCMTVSVTNQTLTIPATAEAVYDAKYGSGKWAEREAEKNKLGWAFSYI